VKEIHLRARAVDANNRWHSSLPKEYSASGAPRAELNLMRSAQKGEGERPQKGKLSAVDAKKRCLWRLPAKPRQEDSDEPAQRVEL